VRFERLANPSRKVLGAQPGLVRRKFLDIDIEVERPVNHLTGDRGLLPDESLGFVWVEAICVQKPFEIAVGAPNRRAFEPLFEVRAPRQLEVETT